MGNVQTAEVARAGAAPYNERLGAHACATFALSRGDRNDACQPYPSVRRVEPGDPARGGCRGAGGLWWRRQHASHPAAAHAAAAAAAHAAADADAARKRVRAEIVAMAVEALDTLNH